VNADHPALRPWNNAARKALPRGVLAWLGLLVSVYLASGFFVTEHLAARWVLGGFVVSHVIVFAGPALFKSFQLRAGTVSLLHVLCWTPGLILVLGDLIGGVGGAYAVWAWALALVTAIAFFFDIRDSAVLIKHLTRRNNQSKTGLD
jgi:hypothetical protein